MSHNWKLGASTAILNSNGGMTDEGFENYMKNGIEYAELSVTYDGLERLGFYDDPSKIKKLAEEYGVKFWSFHIPFGENINPAILDDEKNEAAMDIMKKSICQAAKMGIKTIVVHPSAEPNEPKDREAKLVRATENLKILSDLCQSLGAVLAVEDLPRTCLGNCSDDIIRFLDSIENLMFCFDTNHLTVQKNEDFLDEFIRRGMHGRVRTVHISDYDGIDEKHRLPFDGINNWENIISKLKELGYDGVFMYEVDKAWDRETPYTLADIAENYHKMQIYIEE